MQLSIKLPTSQVQTVHHATPASEQCFLQRLVIHRHTSKVGLIISQEVGNQDFGGPHWKITILYDNSLDSHRISFRLFDEQESSLCKILL